ncbi:MAG: glycerate kinase, partial [Verrucomicrobiales bacterium]
TARYALCTGDIAVMEMASASGFELVSAADRDLLHSSTEGTGQLLRHAAQASGARKILIGIGGSATNDGGTGMARALGYHFLDTAGHNLRPLPADLLELNRIEAPDDLALPPIEVACDVDNPLLGPNGATAIYGPQKGATPDLEKELEARLAHLVAITGANEQALVPGAGAAGGLGFGLLHFAHASLRPGFDIVADALNLRERLARADLVITGEGSIDAQTLSGKGPAGIARLAKEAGKPTLALAGHIALEVKEAGLFDHHASLSEIGLPLETLMAEAAPLLTRRTREALDELSRC